MHNIDDELVAAAAAGRAPEVAALLHHGASSLPLLRSIVEPRTPGTPCSPLRAAALLGDPELTEELLRLGADAAETDSHGETLIHSLALVRRDASRVTGFAATLARLIEAGAPLHAVCRDQGGTALHTAINTGQPAGVIAALIAAGADTAAPNHAGRTPVHCAASKLDAGALRALAEGGADLAAGMPSPALHFAVYAAIDRSLLAFDETPAHMERLRETVQALSDAGISVNQRSVDGHSALHIAAGCAEPWIAEILIDAGADVHAVTPNGKTPLHAACGRWNDRTAALLIRHGADAHAVTTAGANMVHCAARDRTAGDADAFLPVLDLLAAEGVAFDAVTADARNTAAHYACGTGCHRMLGALLERGTPADLPNAQGETPLMAACAYGLVDPVALLLEAGADPNRADAHGASALQMVGVRTMRPYASYSSIVPDLIRAGADPDKRDQVGESALFHAVRGRDAAIVRALLDAGADHRLRNNAGKTALDVARDDASVYLNAHPSQARALLEAAHVRDAMVNAYASAERVR